MKDRTRTVLHGFTMVLLALVLWSLLVAAGVQGAFRDLFHPRVYSRALASAVFLVVLASWRLSVVFRSRSTEPGTLRGFIPLLLLLALVPAAVHPPQSDYSGLDFTPGGRVLSTSAPTGSSQSAVQQPSEQTDLLAAVDEVLADTPETVPETHPPL